MKKYLSLSLTTLLLIGCANTLEQNALNTTPHKINANFKINNILSTPINIQKGTRLKDVIKTLESSDDYLFVIKFKHDIKINKTLNNISLKDLLTYINISTGIRINIKKYGDKLYGWEESTHIYHKPLKKENSDINIIPSYPIKITGEGFSYIEIFNLLREKNINVYIDNSVKNFDYNKKITNFEGNTRNLITFICSKEGLFIEKTPEGFELSKTKTKTYDLKLPPISISGTNPNGKPLSLISQKIEIMQNLKDDLSAILSPDAKVTLNPSNGTISVKGSYDDIKVADAQIKSFMDRFDKTISIEMNIYEVELNNDQGFGVDYNRLINKLTGKFMNLSIGQGKVLFTKSDTPNNIKFVSSEGEEKINSIIFSFLNKYGRTKILTKPTLETINNLPVALSLSNDTDYIKEINENTSAYSSYYKDNNSSYRNEYYPPVRSTSIKPETFKGGFHLKLLPRIVDNKIKIALEAIISKLNRLETIDLSTNTSKRLIQLKHASTRAFSQIVSVNEGEMAIIGGYVDSFSSSDKSTLPGTGENDSVFDFLTSSKKRQDKRKEIVITIKARVVN